MRSCFHADAVIELHKELNVEEFLALGRQILGQYTVTWHNTGNQLGSGPIKLLAERSIS